MAIFNSYVKLPEDEVCIGLFWCGDPFFWGSSRLQPHRSKGTIPCFPLPPFQATWKIPSCSVDQNPRLSKNPKITTESQTSSESDLPIKSPFKSFKSFKHTSSPTTNHSPTIHQISKTGHDWAAGTQWPTALLRGALCPRLRPGLVEVGLGTAGESQGTIPLRICWAMDQKYESSQIGMYSIINQIVVVFFLIGFSTL